MSLETGGFGLTPDRYLESEVVGLAPETYFEPGDMGLTPDPYIEPVDLGLPPEPHLEEPDDVANVQLTPTRSNESQVNRYLTTASAKRRRKKEGHCQFCEKDLAGSQFLDHLKKEDVCRKYYFKIWKVKTVEDFLLKIYSCEICFHTQHLRFKKHLLENPACLEGYKLKLKMNEIDVEEICKKVASLKRALQHSRTVASRALDYKKKKVEDEKSKSTAMSLNEYRASTTFFNYKKCVCCLSNFGEFGARELSEDEELFEQFQLGSFPKNRLRRMEKYFICNQCDAEESVDGIKDEAFSSYINLGEVAGDNHITFFPREDVVPTANQEVTEHKITLMLPFNCDSLDKVQHLSKIKTMNHVVSKLYENVMVERSNVSAIYENEIYKYKCVKLAEDKVTAVVKNFPNKKITDVVKLTDSSKVSCSSGWFRHQKDNMVFRKHQFGANFITVKINLPQTTLDNCATAILQEGVVISVDKKGLANGELKTFYSIHLDHRSEADCDETCRNKEDLEEYLRNGQFDKNSLANKNVGVYVSAIHQKLNAFVKHIVQAPASGLFSEKYHFLLVFDSSGQASIVGCLWPTALTNLNLDVVENDDLEIEGNIITFVERNLSATSDARVLRSCFKLSEVEAQSLADVVKEQQVHECGNEREECSICSSLDLPSLETMIKRRSSSMNHEEATRLNILMRKLLLNLTIEEKKSLSTLKWLEEIWSGFTGEITENFEVLQVLYEEEEEEFRFEIDSRLSRLLGHYDQSPLTAVYHYSISSSFKHDECKIVMKRLWILDSFIKPFNNLFLKCFNSTISVELVDNTTKFENYISREKVEIPQEADPLLIFSHNTVSLAEAVSQMDRRKKRSKSNSITEFVNAISNRRVTLKRAVEHSEDNYVKEGSDEQYQIVPNNISRHFNRINGENLLLAESVLWYDFMGAEKSTELFQTYSGEAEVPKSEDKCVSSDEYLPEMLLCLNGDVLKKRKTMKVLVYPRPKSDFDTMYQRCLLFLNLKSENELLENNLKQMFIQSEAIIDQNERKLFPMKLMKKRVQEGEASTAEVTIATEVVDPAVEKLDWLIEALEDEEIEDEGHEAEKEDADPAESRLDILLEVLE